MATSAHWRLLRDELAGFARSKVMLVLWLLMPGLALAGFLLLPAELMGALGHQKLSAVTFMSLIESSLGGTVAALMVAVDLVSEKNRNVYVLFAIRPIRRESIVWAKFAAVTICVVAACLIAMLLGFIVDVLRGDSLSGAQLGDAGNALVSMTAVIAVSAAAGTLFGVMARSILIAVILVLYVGQNLTVVPMLPMYLGILPSRFWLVMVLSAVLVGVLVWLAGVMFRRAQL